MEQLCAAGEPMPDAPPGSVGVPGEREGLNRLRKDPAHMMTCVRWTAV